MHAYNAEMPLIVNNNSLDRKCILQQDRQRPFPSLSMPMRITLSGWARIWSKTAWQASALDGKSYLHHMLGFSDAQRQPPCWQVQPHPALVQHLLSREDQAKTQQSVSPWMGICIVDVKLVNRRPCQDLVTEHTLCKVCLPSEIPSVQDSPKGALKQKHKGSLQGQQNLRP